MRKILNNQDKIFKNNHHNKPTIILYYSVFQPIYTDLLQSGTVNKLIQGIPPLKDFEEQIKEFKDVGGSICVFDDLGSEIASRVTDFEHINTVYVHHYK